MPGSPIQCSSVRKPVRRGIGGKRCSQYHCSIIIFVSAKGESTKFFPLTKLPLPARSSTCTSRSGTKNPSPPCRPQIRAYSHTKTTFPVDARSDDHLEFDKMKNFERVTVTGSGERITKYITLRHSSNRIWGRQFSRYLIIAVRSRH